MDSSATHDPNTGLKKWVLIHRVVAYSLEVKLDYRLVTGFIFNATS